MLIEDYRLEVFEPPCIPGAPTWSAKAYLTKDISCVLPYLNAVIKKGFYDPSSKTLVWRNGNRRIAVRPLEVGATNLADREEAEKVIKEIIDLVNDTWEKRNEITPSEEARKPPTAMEIYKLLPRTNCKECGASSCFVFATQLAGGEVELERCKPLFTADFAENKKKLMDLLGM